MFTLEQIDDIHTRLGKMGTLYHYLQALRGIGVDRYDSYLTDGHSEYFGIGQKLVSPSVHEKLTVADTGDKQTLRRHLSLHAKGKTTYIQMSRGLAESGVEKWTFDTHASTITYYDKTGVALLRENITR